MGEERDLSGDSPSICSGDLQAGGGGRTRHQGRFQCEAFPWPAVCVGSSKSHHQLIAPDSTLEMRKARLEEFSLFAWSHR